MKERLTRLAYSSGGEKEEAARVAPPPGGARAGRLSVNLEKRPSNRVVTLVRGLPGGPAFVRSVARALKTACATGGSVDGNTLELQGDHRERVEEWLRRNGLRRTGGRTDGR
jgi:translation initiation factor 1